MWRNLSESERGIAFLNSDIIFDVEYQNLCRMTVERCDDGHIAIVCAIYGLMVQAVICEEEDYLETFQEMKTELPALLECEGEAFDNEDDFNAFFARYTAVKKRTIR